jgi:hypothetical protein
MSSGQSEDADKTKRKQRLRLITSILFAITGVAFLIGALEERVIDGGPIHYTWICLAITWFALAFVFFVRHRQRKDVTDVKDK